MSTQVGLTGEFGEHVDRSEFFARHLLYAAVALGVLLPAVFGDPEHGLVRRFLANRVLLWLGLISYGLYLWHAAVFHQLGVWGYGEVADSTHRYTWWLTGTAATIVVAAASYYLVERNALRLKWLVGRRGEPGPPGEAIREPAPVTPGAGTRAG